jgi:hypothetical protein
MVALARAEGVPECERREQERDQRERGGERDECGRRLWTTEEQGQRPPQA